MGLRKKMQAMLIGKVTATLLIKAARGDFGPQARATYWFLRGKKGYFFLAFTILAAGLYEADRSGTCAELAFAQCASLGAKFSAAGALVSGYLSQVDGALHMDAPEKE